MFDDWWGKHRVGDPIALVQVIGDVEEKSVVPTYCLGQGGQFLGNFLERLPGQKACLRGSHLQAVAFKVVLMHLVRVDEPGVIEVDLVTRCRLRRWAM